VVMCVARPRTLRGRWATVEWYGRDTCAYKARTEIGTLPRLQDIGVIRFHAAYTESIIPQKTPDL
jgi:hypothetical protein